MKSKAPYFGKIRLFWCPTCNCTLLENKCRNCGVRLKSVTLAPPGDIRPAFSRDWNLLLSLVENEFGTSAMKSLKSFENSLILFNKAPHEDRLDEIIINGKSVGIISYDIHREEYRFIPKPELAKILIKGKCRNVIHLKSGTTTFLKKKSSILFPGIDRLDSGIKTDHPVIIIEDSKVIATGISKIDGKEFDAHSKGIAAKIKYLANSNAPILYPENINDFIRNNRAHILDFQKEAINFIRDTVRKEQKKPIISYSGGKDSLVTAHLVSLALNDGFDVMFIDTGFEFPETSENASRFAAHILKGDMSRFHTKEVDDDYFWEIFAKFGPPARDARYCCKKSKLGPISQLLTEKFPDQDVLAFLGSRKYESETRHGEQRVSKNRWIPNQINVAPIMHWNALDVFVYIWIHQLTDFINPLYKKGFVRIGCWLCPASNMADFRIVSKLYPEKYNKLIDNLQMWKIKENYSNDWLKLGLWRWKIYPRKITNYLKSKGISAKLDNENHSSRIQFNLIASISPCKEEITVILETNAKLLLNRVRGFINLIGTELNSPNSELRVLGRNVYSNGFTVVICDSGTIRIRMKRDKSIKGILNDVITTVVRSMECTECMICKNHCKSDCIQLIDNQIVVDQYCSGCGTCTDFCPIIKYFYNDIREQMKEWHFDLN